MNEINLVYSFGKVLFQAKISLFYYVNEKYIDNPSQLSSDSAHRIEGISCIDLFSFSLSHLICDSKSNVVWYKKSFPLSSLFWSCFCYLPWTTKKLNSILLTSFVKWRTLKHIHHVVESAYFYQPFAKHHLHYQPLYLPISINITQNFATFHSTSPSGRCVPLQLLSLSLSLSSNYQDPKPRVTKG